MNIKTKYLGKELRSPIVISANPLSEDVENIKKMEDAGVGAVVLFSLFEEQIKMEQKEIMSHETSGEDIYAESTSFFPDPGEYRSGPENYLDLISRAKDAVDIPIIPSLNGSTTGGWINYAKKMEDAGADALELNIYNIPTDMDTTAEDIENQYLEVVKAVKSAVKIPVAIKLSPFFTNFANFAKKLDATGIDGMVMFNRFYQPDINLESLEVEPNILLSHSAAMRLPMRWIAILNKRINADMAATSGIHTGADVIKMMMVGAKTAMMCSAVLQNGIDHIKTVEKEMIQWMESNEYESIEQMQGSMSQKSIKDASVYERAQYMKALSSYISTGV